MAGIEPPDGTKEIIEGVTEAIKQRLGSPILFGFLASWCFLNYKFLLVIFAEDSFKTKFHYIAENLEMAFWRPVVVGILLALLLPILEVPYRAFRAFCKNMELRAEMWVQHRVPMDSNQQAAAFRKRDEDIEELRKEVVSLDIKAQNIENANARDATALHGRIASACLFYLGAYTRFNDRQLRDIIVANIANIDDRSDLLSGLKNHPSTRDITKFVNFMEGIRIGGGSTEINIESLRSHMAIDSERFIFFTDVLVSIGFLIRPVRDSSLYWTCPFNNHSYSVAADIFRDASR